MNPKIEEIVATLREYAPDEDGTQRYILIPAAGRGADMRGETHGTD